MNTATKSLLVWIVIFAVVVLLWQSIQSGSRPGPESAEPAEESSLVAVFYTWGPVLVIVALWIFFMRRFQAAGNKALAAGRAGGFEQGLQQGEVTVLKRQLARRFGSVPDWAVRRLEEASPEELERWSERILDARRLEEVFDG